MRYGSPLIRGLVVLAACSLGRAGAELPTLEEKEWLGHFVGFEGRKYRFGLTSEGEASIRIIGDRDELIGKSLTIDIEFLVEEVSSDGKVTRKTLKPETLESQQEPTHEPKGVVFQGQVTGDAKFEVTVDEDRGVLSLGGRLVDAGKLENPVRYSIVVKVPDAYPYEKADPDRSQQKAFDDKSRGDRMQVTWTDGKRVRLSTSDPVDAGSENVNGPGIAAAQFEFSAYDGKRIEIAASGDSVMNLSNTREGPLYDGFLITWTSDTAKDSGGKARLNIEVR